MLPDCKSCLMAADPGAAGTVGSDDSDDWMPATRVGDLNLLLGSWLQLLAGTIVGALGGNQQMGRRARSLSVSGSRINKEKNTPRLKGFRTFKMTQRNKSKPGD